MKHISEALEEGVKSLYRAEPDESRARICPPCYGNCNQGDDCPAREVRPIRGAGLIPAVIVGACMWAACLLFLYIAVWSKK